MEQQEKRYYNLSPQQAMKKIGSGPEGLSETDVEESRKRYGANVLAEVKKKSVFLVFAEQFKDLLVLILIIAAIISAITGSAASTVVILFVLVMNAILGTVQYVKAEKSLESLKKLSSPSAKVVREGREHVIAAEELVCGDIIVLEAGDIVPGDARVIDAFSLKTNESSLTGESQAVEKNADLIKDLNVALGDQYNMVFSGSLVTYGRASAVVTAVGKQTELGKIAGLMDEVEKGKTPLQVTMDNFSKKLSIAIMAICILVFALSMWRGMRVTDALLFAVALAVAAIPEALSSIITISLAIGTSRMADQNAIIKDLNAVEGLGCVSVICSDKTGTLTQNRMTVEYEHAYEGSDRLLRMASILCNDSRFADGEVIGDPTETAFVDYFIAKNGREEYEKVLADYPRLSEVPFDSGRKLMSTLHKIDGKYLMFTKGALDVILQRTENLTQRVKRELTEENFMLSDSGLRVLAFAVKEIGSEREIGFEDEEGFSYIGLLAEMDPPRKESAQAVADCISAGIRPIMITGDHKVTASAIARQIGIMEDEDIAVTGPELDSMSEEQLNAQLENISVYARVSPENKIRIVRAWQAKGHICAMTGDGVNDAPALKSADVGVAMGITGTEVAKDAASMILTDDNFATIIKSVLNGRNIYENIKSAIKYLLSGNAAAIVVVLFASLSGLPTPFTAVQLLFINLITDSLPALAISMEPANRLLISQKPRPRDESVLNRQTLWSICGSGILISLSVCAAFLAGLGYLIVPGVSEKMTAGAVSGSTMAFATLCLARLFHGFNSRSRECIFKLGLTSNMWSVGAFALGALLLHCILRLPVFKTAFGVSQLGIMPILLVWVFAFIPSVIIQIFKYVRSEGRHSGDS